MKQRSRSRFLLEAIEGAAVMGAAFTTWPVAKRWLQNWGATRAEQYGVWPGDELVAANLDSHTRAVSVAAPASRVWQWVVQLGVGRGGFYSYELLERLVGIDVTNIESIEADLQHLKVGDEILLHPKEPGIRVSLLEPERHLCFGDDPDNPSAEPKPEVDRSWSIYVEPVTDDSCRLLLRSCFQAAPRRSLRSRVSLALTEPIDFVMEQRMLRTIKRLAERA